MNRAWYYQIQFINRHPIKYLGFLEVGVRDRPLENHSEKRAAATDLADQSPFSAGMLALGHDSYVWFEVEEGVLFPTERLIAVPRDQRHFWFCLLATSESTSGL